MDIKTSVWSEEKGQARIILTMMLVPITLILFLVMLMISSPLLDQLFPVIDNMAAAGTLSMPSILKLIIALIPTIIIMLWIYSMVTEIGQK
jgi:protein-S-isoprenylcysteine O-methyltransferase Ste14